LVLISICRTFLSISLGIILGLRKKAKVRWKKGFYFFLI